MKAISLWQPWATLVAREAKRIETRHWPAPSRIIGERIAIHATKANDHHWLLGQEPFATDLAGVTYPLGAIVCTLRVMGCEAITPEMVQLISQREQRYGDFRTGRYAWHLADVHPLAAPLPFKGRQGFFDVPDTLWGSA